MLRSVRTAAVWAIVLLVAAVVYLYSNRGTQPHGETARIVRVIDGDSYVVLFEGREQQVRAIGIDAPEGSVKALEARGEDKSNRQATIEVEAGRLAATHASSLLPVEKEVILLFDPANESIGHRDRYGRLLAFIYCPGDAGVRSASINEKMVADGYAEALTTFRFDEQMKDNLVSAERRARRSRSGIWGLHPEVFE